jgi:hypothetical protein
VDFGVVEAGAHTIGYWMALIWCLLSAWLHPTIAGCLAMPGKTVMAGEHLTWDDASDLTWR